tara:strand:+ start:1071 stop:1811 length:741 start_codon:yes stop_codon:yes gene_type:complete
MLNKEDLDYFNYGNIENKKFWKRLKERPDFKNKSILDFGCGHGSLCIDIAKSGANSVTGIDINKKLLKFATENLNTNYSDVSKKIKFEEKDLLKDNFNKKFDIIVTKDTFEHSLNLPDILNRFYDLLNDGGKAYIGFGPLYNSYNGDHGRTQLKIPWMHVILSEKTIIKRYNKQNSNKIDRIEDLGLSKYSFKDYKKIFSESKFKIDYFITNQSDHPVGKVFNILSKINFLKEYFTFNIYCILKKI